MNLKDGHGQTRLGIWCCEESYMLLGAAGRSAGSGMIILYIRCSEEQLALVLELAAKYASEQVLHSTCNDRFFPLICLLFSHSRDGPYLPRSALLLTLSLFRSFHHAF